ncbi:hypothetical protein BHE74_00004584 [Ensete ventricosum]|nr:hypothetical protein BHE74_00004584 [Ensete ventricosum]
MKATSGGRRQEQVRHRRLATAWLRQRWLYPTEEQREKDQMMPGDRCRSRWFRRQRRQRTGAVGSGRRHQMAAVGSGEEEEHSLGHWHRSMGPTVEEVERAPR